MTYAIGKNLLTCEYPVCGQPVTHKVEWFKKGTLEVGAVILCCEDCFRIITKKGWGLPS